MSLKVRDKQEEIKIIFLHESGAGNTSIINAIIGYNFFENYYNGFNGNYAIKTINIQQKSYNLYLWDIIGQEKFRSLAKLFIKGANISIFVYDITYERSFTELEFWFKYVEDIIGKNIIKGIMGNKSDLYEYEEIPQEDAIKYAESKKAKIRFVSAKEDPKGIQDFIRELVYDYHCQKYGNIKENDIQLNKKIDNKILIKDKIESKKKQLMEQEIERKKKLNKQKENFINSNNNHIKNLAKFYKY